MKKINVIYLLATLLLTSFFSIQAKAQSTQFLDVGDKVPSFSLMDQDGKTFNIGDYIGKRVIVLYFYPKDEGMVCTKEACSFRDSFDAFTKAGAMVIGINGGSVASHKKFQDHYKLPFTLLSDPNDKVYRMFGIKNVLFMTGRKTFVVNKTGVIAFSYDAMLQGKEHADGALKFIKSQALN